MTKPGQPERVSGMRVWEVVQMTAECPECGWKNAVDAGTLDADELWYGQPVSFWCDGCGCEFEAVADDDNR